MQVHLVQKKIDVSWTDSNRSLGKQARGGHEKRGLNPKRTTKGIASEARLVWIFQKFLMRVQSAKLSGFLEEFDCSNGVADLVVYKLRRDWKNRTSLGHISARWVYALHELPYRRVFTVEDFSTIAGVTQRRARDALQEFAKLGFCVKGATNDVWIKIKQPQYITTYICAIEAKLRNWKKALSQAVRHLDYANQSWVLLDSACLRPAIQNIKEFRRLNVGLASMSSDGNVEYHYVPKIRRPHSDPRLWQANAIIAFRITHSNNL